MNRKNKLQVKYTLMSITSLTVFFLVWWLATDVLQVASANALPSPVTVIKTFITKLNNTAPDGATMVEHIGSSVIVAMTGYLVAIVIGVPMGILMAWYKPIDLFVRPLFDLLRPIPGIAWIPLMIIIFGIGLGSKVSVVFMAALIPCILNSYTGIRQTRDVHLWVGQTFGATNFQMLTQIAIPTSLPLVMTGIRVALGVSWTTIVAAELLASTRGLGFMIQQARGIFRPDIIIAGMIAIGAIGALLSWVLTIIEKKIVKGVRL